MGPSRWREIAVTAVKMRDIPIRLACQTFVISEGSYRYQAKHSAENDAIGDWLLKLTDNHRH